MGVDIMAQYEENKNFELFQDEFDIPGRMWDENTYYETTGKWRAYFRGSITHGTNEHQAYQRSQAVFDDTNNMMLLIADYVSDINLTCDDLETPNNHCQIDSSYNIRYLSGALQSLEKSFLYGYFEMRCKLPVHRGAFPAFWLWGQCRPENNGCDDPHYEEIDIFEYSWVFTDSISTDDTEALYLGDNRYFIAGVYINNDGEIDSLWWERTAKAHQRIPDNKPSLDQWNTWGCLWMPDKVEWYLNGELFNSLYDTDKIPSNPMYLMANYAIDRFAFNDEGSTYYNILDTMHIDYIRVYQPKWDYYSIVIDEQSDVDNYQHGIKSSVTICSNSNAPIVVGSNHKLDIMASESVTVNGPFQVDVGTDFSIRMQKSPELINQ